MSRLILTFICMCSLLGCASKPPIQEQPSKVTLSLVADTALNPNVLGESSAVELQVFELEDDSMFMSADFDQLNTHFKKALKSNFVEVYDYVLTPGQFKFVDELILDEETRYIGVLAKFSEPQKSDWKKAIKVINPGRTYHVLVFAQGQAVTIKKVE